MLIPTVAGVDEFAREYADRLAAVGYVTDLRNARACELLLLAAFITDGVLQNMRVGATAGLAAE